MTTLDAVASKKRAGGSSPEAAAAAELVRMAREQGLSLTGPDGLLKQFTRAVLETALNEEMTEHLGYEPGQVPEDRETGNVRNGTRSKNGRSIVWPFTPTSGRRPNGVGLLFLGDDGTVIPAYTPNTP